MIAWRICKKKRLTTALNGQGAADFPGRWNIKGQFVAYLGESRALASLEVLAHAEDRSLLNNVDWVAIPIEFDEDLVTELSPLPEGWDAVPSSLSATAAGCDWYLSKKSVLLRVPSVVVKGEFNYVLNASHQDAGKVVIGTAEPFSFDPRIAREPSAG
ncbi:MAG TPA: RES family NAD+ phosphorylase [Opitutaceae bacterium]|nr:RES family NAD+ phosphorylase [Opitutaceae bacterium]